VIFDDQRPAIRGNDQTGLFRTQAGIIAKRRFRLIRPMTATILRMLDARLLALSQPAAGPYS
jgi:hypothetical protein